MRPSTRRCLPRMADRCTSGRSPRGWPRSVMTCMCSSRQAMAAFPPGRAAWVSMPPPLGSRRLRLLRSGAVLRAARALRPDVVIERYYNFGGEGLLAARRLGALAVLEVNAPVIDHPGSAKQWLDRLLIAQPLRRWRDWQCRVADLIVTPSARILPDHVPPSRVLQTEWGADTDAFRPGATGAVPFARASGDTIVVFVGAFRAWHGAHHLVDAMKQLRARGRHDIKAVLIGEGPELQRVRRRSRRRARHHLYRRASACGGSGMSCRCRCRGRAVRFDGASDACARVPLVAAQDLRVHVDWASGRRAADRAARACRSRRTRRLAL